MGEVSLARPKGGMAWGGGLEASRGRGWVFSGPAIQWRQKPVWRAGKRVQRGQWAGNCGLNSGNRESRVREPWKGQQREPRHRSSHVQRAEAN